MSRVLRLNQLAPEIKGATATNQYKEATCENGLVIQVPPFMKVGDRVNLEADLLAKYTERLLLAGANPAAAAPAQDLSASWLAEHGWG